MKFGKQFEFYKIPEWSEYYLDYDGIKTVIKFLDKRRLKKKQLKKIKKIKAKLRKLSTQIEESKSSDDNSLINTNQVNVEPKDENLLIPEKKTFLRSNSLSVKTEKIIEAEDLSGYSNEEKLTKFTKIYQKKIGAVNEFFMKKLEEFIQNFEKMKNKMNGQNNSLLKSESNLKRTRQQLNAERDEMGYAVSWKRALSSLYNETSWLHSYHSINLLAIKKIEKKIKKIFKINEINGIELALSEVDNGFPFFNDAINRLVELRKNIKKLYATEFTNSDLLKASNEVESRLQGSGKIKHTKLIYLYFGIIFSCLLFMIFLNYIPSNGHSITNFFPAFNFGIVIIEAMIGCACVISILKKYRINYVYILEIDLKARLGPTELFQNAFMMLAIYMVILLLMKLSLNFDFFGGQYGLFALIINGFFVIFLFLPFHIMYYSFRKGIVKVLIRNFFPIGRNTVRFKDFLFGDILTSLNKPFTSLLLSYCLMSCTDCESEYKRNEKECNRDTIPCLIVLFYPFFIRFTQCINRYYYTRQKWPHLGNTLKYVGGLSNAICGWIYSRYKTDKALIAHLLAGIISQSYMLFWDIYVDWGLGRFGTKNFFLRDKIVYPKNWYYFAIVVDLILRFSWTWNFIKIDKQYDEWKNLVMALLEAYRRIQWCVFRIENENCSNPENYRTILAIPELPLD